MIKYQPLVGSSIVDTSDKPEESPMSLQHTDLQYRSSYNLTIAFVVHLAQLHVILMVISVPILICVPDGCMFPRGNIRMISDGFKANSAISTAVWGSGIAWVTVVRYLGVANTPLFYSSIAQLCVPLATYSAFLTLRYDMLEDFHVIFATLWIVSSFTLHFCVTLNGRGNRPILAHYVLWCGISFGVVFVALFILVEVDKNELLDVVRTSANLASTELLSVIAMLEVMTVYSLLLLDFVLCGMVLDTYMNGVGVFLLVSMVESKFRRILIQIGISIFYIFLTLVIVVSLVRVL